MSPKQRPLIEETGRNPVEDAATASVLIDWEASDQSRTAETPLEMSGVSCFWVAISGLPIDTRAT